MSITLGCFGMVMVCSRVNVKENNANKFLHRHLIKTELHIKLFQHSQLNVWRSNSSKLSPWIEFH